MVSSIMVIETDKVVGSEILLKVAICLFIVRFHNSEVQLMCRNENGFFILGSIMSQMADTIKCMMHWIANICPQKGDT
jgi:hypothetical protein